MVFFPTSDFKFSKFSFCKNAVTQFAGTLSAGTMNEEQSIFEGGELANARSPCFSSGVKKGDIIASERSAVIFFF